MEYIWNTSWEVRTCGIYVRISDVAEIKSEHSAERVRFLIQNNECVNTVKSPLHVVLCLLMRVKFFFIVFSDKPRQNSVTRLQVKNSCKD